MDAALPKAKADFNARLRDVPHKPGVYLMRDRLNRVIYVGKARDLRKRVGSYFMPSRQQSADLKTRAMIESVWDFEVHTVKSEPEALLLEGKLIKEYRPRYNISFRDDKRFLLVKVNFEDPIPRFQLTRLRREDGARYYGPFAHSGALRATLNVMRDKFGLRSCRPAQPGETDFKHCLAPVIKNCPAPCIGRINREDYRSRVMAAAEFLEGRSREMIGTLEEQMRAAAAKMDFEKAAELRDMVNDLRRTTAPTRRFTRHSLPSSIDPVADLRALGDALQLPHLPMVMECFDISNISTTHIVASMVSFRNGVPDKSNYRRYRIRTVHGQNDFASMAEVVRRRYARVLLDGRAEYADAAEYSQENPADAIERLARAAATAPVEIPPEDPAPLAGIAGEPNNVAGDVLIEGPGYVADETDAELDHELERALEAEDLAAGGLPDLVPGDATHPPEALAPVASRAAPVRLPDLVIVDGGKGQLSSACAELQRLGLHDLAIIGLAKEFEEIYRPGRPLPLRLPEDSGALRLLQRIRDEAHRFANSYHQLLMKRRIGESILDDCPGVSENRKQLLLRAFGSLERLRRATPEQIAGVEGIGPKLADDLHRFLQAH
jgi:excinuclease ABC subunit C